MIGRIDPTSVTNLMMDCEALIVLQLDEGMRVKGHPGLEVTPGAVACDPKDPSVLAVPKCPEQAFRVHSVVMRDDDLLNYLPPHATYSKGLHTVIDLPYCLTHPMTTVTSSAASAPLLLLLLRSSSVWHLSSG